MARWSPRPLVSMQVFKLLNAFKKSSVTQQAAPAPASVAAPAESPMSEEEKWARKRAPQLAHERVLSGWTRGWLQGLPEAVRPLELSSLHPHVANRLALSWRDVALTEHLLGELLIGRRKGRTGFAPPVLAELLRLRDFHERGRVASKLQAASPPANDLPTQSKEPEWARLRGPQRPMDAVLSSMARDWLETLPGPMRPAELCAAYPRVANRLALCWNDPALTERLLDDLLIGRRGKRKGFPRPVAEELLRLRRFHDHYRGTDVQETVWEYRMLAVSDR
jgi:hypothetical protein